MKKLAVALMLASSVAYGQNVEWVAKMPNKAGGQIVLLSAKGNCVNGSRMYAAAPSGNMVWGCWIAMDSHVIVLWDSGEQKTSAFEYSAWEINPAISNKTERNTKFY